MAEDALYASVVIGDAVFVRVRDDLGNRYSYIPHSPPSWHYAKPGEDYAKEEARAHNVPRRVRDLAKSALEDAWRMLDAIRMQGSEVE